MSVAVVAAGFVAGRISNKMGVYMTKKLSPSLLRLSSASRVLNIPASTLKYHTLVGNIKRHDYGQFWLLDVEEVREVFSHMGYKPRKPVEV